MMDVVAARVLKQFFKSNAVCSRNDEDDRATWGLGETDIMCNASKVWPYSFIKAETDDSSHFWVIYQLRGINLLSMSTVMWSYHVTTPCF